MERAFRALLGPRLPVILIGMDHSPRAFARQALAYFVLLVCCAGVACTAPDGRIESAPLCPGCKPISGGETTSFARPGQALVTPCYAITLTTQISEEEAVAKGFPIAALRARLEREQEQTFQWQKLDTMFGARATGFDSETRIRIKPRLASYLWSHPDLDRCEADPCTYMSDRCGDSLTIGLRISVETLDGAMAGELDGWTFYGDDLDAATSSFSGVADITSLIGSLQLQPSFSKPYFGIGSLMSFEHARSGMFSIAVGELGDTWIEDIGAVHDVPNLASEVSYHPLRGTWGDAPDISGPSAWDIYMYGLVHGH